MAEVFLESTTPGAWLVPADWNANDNSVEGIGGGAGGGPTIDASTSGLGGGGGGDSKKVNLNLTPGSWVPYSVGAGGEPNMPGGDTWFQSPAVLLAKGGNISLNPPNAVAFGGQASEGVGDVKYSGGNARSGASGGSAGGAAGPNGNGGLGLVNGGAGDAGFGGAGGSAASGGIPADGAEWGSYGSGGGGQRVSNLANGKNGGKYGGGGSGGAASDNTIFLGGFGAQGLIRITYKPVDTVVDSIIKAT
jgi:hypothetical protein